MFRKTEYSKADAVCTASVAVLAWSILVLGKTRPQVLIFCVFSEITFSQNLFKKVALGIFNTLLHVGSIAFYVTVFRVLF